MNRMPIYTFVNKETNEEITETMTISERDKFIEENPQMKQKIVAPRIVAGVMGVGSHRVSDGFKEVLQKVKSTNHGSNINTM